MEPVQEKALEVPKLNQETQKQEDLEVKAMLEKGSISSNLSLKRGIFEQFVSDQQKRWRETTSHKFEGSETLRDGKCALSEVCVTKRGLHKQNRPEGCIIQRSSTQRITKISTVSLGRELARGPMPLLRFGTNSLNIYKIIKGSNLSF